MIDRCTTDFWINHLHDQVVCITGKVFVDGEWTDRKECVRRVQAHGGSYKPDYSRRVHLVVYGDLASASVTDPIRQYSQKLDLAQADRQRGHHVHVVDALGFSDLLDHGPARCRELKPRGGASVLPEPQTGDGILGGPRATRLAAEHGHTGLALDLRHLNAGTAAHEQTVQNLARHLAAREVAARGLARGAPLFDLGWADRDITFIAEVKSLTGTSEDQQIRLGFGQLLDYAHQLRSTDSQVTPVLVLERKPASDRWFGLATSEGVILTWGPDFPLI